jgi:LacI family repressor for deo operon, udp, cdd, tsx, nupC, and nupG
MNKKFTTIRLDQNSAFPLANQLARKLTWMIAAGDITEGETLPPIRDFSESLGIHMHTVRAAYHILESRQLVSMRPRVGTVVNEYIPFQSAARPEMTAEGFIAVLIPDMSDFYSQILKGIISVLEKENLIPVVIPCSEDPYYAEAAYKIVSAKDFLGVINITIGFSDEYYEVLRSQNNKDAPLVFIDDFAAVGHRMLADTQGAISLAVSHLAQHGYKDLALINCPGDWPVGTEVLKGFQKGLEGSNLEYQPEDVYVLPDFSYDAGNFCGERILSSTRRPRAVVAASDSLALGAISAFKSGGLKVPEDIAVIGYNDIPIAAIFDPPLTTIALPAFQIGERGANALMKAINGKNEQWIEEVFEGKLVVRKSCGC